MWPNFWFEVYKIDSKPLWYELEPKNAYRKATFVMTHPQVPWWIQLRVQRWKWWKEKELGHIPWLAALWGRGACWSFGWDYDEWQEVQLLTWNLHKPNNKLVSTELKHFWCINEPWANTDSQDSPQPKLGGSHHLPPYSIFCAWPRG